MTNLELKNALRALEARVAELEKRPVLTGDEIMKFVQQMLDCNSLTPKPAEEKSNRGLCPKCQKKPNHFFHVRTCKG